jgi:hypothetical protein
VFARVLRATARRVRIVDRGGGAVARSGWFEDGEGARRRWEALAGDAARLDAAGFRARYRLPCGRTWRAACRSLTASTSSLAPFRSPAR